jgi:hypothetical protein
MTISVFTSFPLHEKASLPIKLVAFQACGGAEP